MTAGVHWIGLIPGDGYGDATLQYLAALDALGVPVTWTPVAWPPRPSESAAAYDGPLAHLVGRAVEHDTVVLHMPPNHAVHWLAQATNQRAVCVCTWETDRLSEESVHQIETFDAVVVPSRFNRDALLASGCSTPVHVVPHIARKVRAVGPPSFERIGDRFLFYVIATWSTRKAMADTIRAFLDAFESRDDVGLVIKTSSDDQQAVARARRGEHLETWTGLALASLLAGRRRVPAIQLIAGPVPSAEIDALHTRGDCFFSLTRSEGWGLCSADAVLFGNPVVITGWGGHLDYLGANYPLLVDFDLVSTASDPVDDWFEARPGFRWARARHDHAVGVLRWVADHPAEAAVLTAPIREHLARECAPQVIGSRLLDALQTVRARKDRGQSAPRRSQHA